MKKKILKIILLLILIILLMFVPSFIYKFIIIYKSDKAYHNLENCDTYKYTYTEEIYSLNDNSNLEKAYSVFSTTYYKDKIFKKVSKTENPEEGIYESIDYEYYTDDACIQIQENSKTFMVSKNEFQFDKMHLVNNVVLTLDNLTVSIDDFFYDIFCNINNIWSYIVTSKIKTETFANKECYRFDIKAYLSTYSFYIDKETFLPIGYESLGKDKKGNIVYRNRYTYDYELNCVTDEDVKLPDYRQYKQVIN